MMPRFLPTLAALALLGACAAPAAPDYYTLVPQAGAPVEPLAGRPRAALVDIAPVAVPAQVDMPQLVVRTGQGEVTPLNGARWVGPLADEIRAALAARVSARLGLPAVQGLRPDAGSQALRVQVEVQRFDSGPGPEAALDAVWRVRAAAPGTPSAPVCHSRLRAPAVGGTAELVDAHQRNLAALGDAIAAAALAADAGRPACPY